MGRLAKTGRKLVIFGTNDFAQIAVQYFTHDSDYEVVALTVDHEHLQEEIKFGLPVVPFDEIEKSFPPSDHALFAALVYGRLNRDRADVCQRAKDKGYKLASYISSRAFVWPNVELGEHCFIFENNTVQPFVTIGDDVVLWSGNQVSHHAQIGSHCFLSGSVAVAGWAVIEEHCFLGINSTFANNTRLGNGSWVCHGCCVSGNIPPKSFIKSVPNEISPLDEDRLFRSLADATMVRSDLLENLETQRLPSPSQQ